LRFHEHSPSFETLSGLLAVRLVVFAMQIYWAAAQIWRSVTTAEVENETAKHSRTKAEPVQCRIDSAVRSASIAIEERNLDVEFSGPLHPNRAPRGFWQFAVLLDTAAEQQIRNGFTSSAG